MESIRCGNMFTMWELTNRFEDRCFLPLSFFGSIDDFTNLSKHFALKQNSTISSSHSIQFVLTWQITMEILLDYFIGWVLHRYSTYICQYDIPSFLHTSWFWVTVHDRISHEVSIYLLPVWPTCTNSCTDNIILVLCICKDIATMLTNCHCAIFTITIDLKLLKYYRNKSA